MQRVALLSLLSLALTPGAYAQGVLPLSGSYRVGIIGSSFGEPPCSPATVPSCGAEVGTAILQPNGTFTAATSALDICPGGITNSSNYNESGTYSVDTQGLLVLDFDPANPGDDIATLFLRADGSAAVGGRTETEPDNFLVIVVRLSSGLGNYSLNGAYHVARLVQFNGASSYSLRAELGIITFNGAGSFTESGTRHSIVMGSTATIPLPYSSTNGSYTVAADGTITGTNIDGAMSADGEIFFWVRRAPGQSEVELTVGVRRGASYPPDLFDGGWGFALMENEIASGNAQLDTDFGVITVTPQTPSGGRLAGTLLNVETSPFSTNASLDPIDEVYTLASDGSFVLAPPAPPGVPGALSAKGFFFLGTCVSPDGAGMFLGVLRCPWPRSFGLATPGTGGIAPLAATNGGFPHLGNAGYGLGITSARGGAPGVLLLSANTTTGIPFLGGTIWLDPSLLLSVPIALTGTPGQAGAGSGFASIGIPNLPSLDGASFAFQGFVADAGAPRGLAMTQALVVALCR
jgi:hypothetical protein